MFEGAATNNGLTQRLRQDMNPGTIRSADPIPSLIPPLPKPVEPPAVVKTAAPAEELIVPEVEAAPFVLKVHNTNKTYLAWIAALMVVPTFFFWLTSLLYTLGARTILVNIVTRIPFNVIVIINVVMPIASVVLGGIMIAKTEPDTASRLIAKVTVWLAGLCIAALVFWLAFEAF